MIVDVKDINKRVNGTKSGYDMMECPWCKSYGKGPYSKQTQAWKFDKWVTPTRARYECQKCKLGVQYEV